VSDGARDIDVAGAWEDLAILFEFAAMLRLAQDRPRDAARLIGAASRLRSKSGPPSEPGHYIAQRETMVRVERKLGTARLAAALADGRSAEVADLVRDLSSILPSNPALRGRYGRLSAREVEVLRLVVDGATDPEIADHLTISPKTASVHVSNLRTKLDATSRIHLAMSGRLLLDAADAAPRE
jgi:DNA-binding NarL/FixJ family response regulator